MKKILLVALVAMLGMNQQMHNAKVATPVPLNRWWKNLMKS